MLSVMAQHAWPVSSSQNTVQGGHAELLHSAAWPQPSNLQSMPAICSLRSPSEYSFDGVKLAAHHLDLLGSLSSRLTHPVLCVL